jgi:hypothetical protein
MCRDLTDKLLVWLLQWYAAGFNMSKLSSGSEASGSTSNNMSLHSSMGWAGVSWWVWLVHPAYSCALHHWKWSRQVKSPADSNMVTGLTVVSSPGMPRISLHTAGW